MEIVDAAYQIHYCSQYNPIALRVNSGASVIFQCKDTYNDLLVDESCLFTKTHMGIPQNPLNGPVYVNGAMPGDTMKITIEEIAVTSKYATMVVNDKLVYKAFLPYVTDEQTILLPISEDGKTADVFGNRVVLNPFPGCLSLAPKERVNTMYPGSHGGNMDCKKLVKGSVFYVPVQVEGGLVATGDIHAYQGDGEIVCGLEVAGRVQLKLEVIKNSCEKWPVLETEDRWYVVASCASIEESCFEAVGTMQSFLLKRCSRYNPHELMVLLSQFADLEICQIVDPLVTVRFGVEKRVVDEVCF